MKRIIIITVIFLGLGFINTSFAARDEVAEDYSNRLNEYRIEIVRKAGAWRQAIIGKHYQNNREMLELNYRGNIPRDVRDDLHRTKNEATGAERDFISLGKEIASLKTEIVKYYKGKVPKNLKNKIAEVQEYYSEKELEVRKFTVDTMQRK